MSSEKFIIYFNNDECKRLDKFLVKSFKERSREYLKKLICGGYVAVNEKNSKPGALLKSGDKVSVIFPSPEKILISPRRLDFKIVFEDEYLLVINKPAGLTVHPGCENAIHDDTLVSGLLFYLNDSLSEIGGKLRPGIVHRLDKDTSGLLLIAKNDKVHRALCHLFKSRMIEKRYVALLNGVLPYDKGIIDAPIGRSRVDRKKMTVGGISPKESKTEFWVRERFKSFTLVDINLKTGRTHQIRVHFKSLGFPVAADKLYSKNSSNVKLSRQFLHASELAFVHPITGEELRFIDDLPNDLNNFLKNLD